MARGEGAGIVFRVRESLGCIWVSVGVVGFDFQRASEEVLTGQKVKGASCAMVGSLGRGPQRWAACHPHYPNMNMSVPGDFAWRSLKLLQIQYADIKHDINIQQRLIIGQKLYHAMPSISCQWHL